MAASQTISSHGAGEGGYVDQLRDMAGFLGFTLPEYAGYILFGQSSHCELTVHIYPRGGTHGIGLHPHTFTRTFPTAQLAYQAMAWTALRCLAHTYASRLTGSSFCLFPRLPSGHTDTGYPCPYRESHPALTRLVELSDAQATQLDLLLEACHALARHSATLEHRLTEEGVTSVDTTSWDSGRLWHSLAQSFYISHDSADTPSRTRTPSSRVPYSPYLSPRPRYRSPPYTPGYSPVTSRRGLRLIRTSRRSVAGPSTTVFRFTPTLAGPAVGPSRQVSVYPPRAPIDKPTIDAAQSEELQ
ncbi:hypothetical protein E2562_014973 [Oryza meyeriana var. granulata]|uniref:Uncharacterized protein n=1 Tax=Oryza meyeriana var. granulata TaxID=110450 RepID=A0A6G1EJ84_9ORYZ|nr:hypothetical protein E2562_014973 [Oryza meyeriana var. granulata]